MKRKAVEEDEDENDGDGDARATNKPTKPGQKIRKLVPPPPWSEPRSGKEGKNYISLTRKTALGAYMRRCKALILDDGYTSIHLSAMGAAIPLLMQLVCSLPDILPHPRNEIHKEVVTGTVEVQDEIIPDDLDKDVEYNTRCKSTLRVTLTVGKEEKEGKKKPEVRVVEEPEQDLPDTDL
ncbi:hypothetical protein APHAL10511_007116 [Amanita phalloides]|nr:hypothetical protein APHAL10511_007116 [Amanita phalloides]